jgi:hypothetical protein
MVGMAGLAGLPAGVGRACGPHQERKVQSRFTKKFQKSTTPIAAAIEKL